MLGTESNTTVGGEPWNSHEKTKAHTEWKVHTDLDDEDEFRPLFRKGENDEDNSEDDYGRGDSVLTKQHRRTLILGCVVGFLFGSLFGTMAYSLLTYSGSEHLMPDAGASLPIQGEGPPAKEHLPDIRLQNSTVIIPSSNGSVSLHVLESKKDSESILEKDQATVSEQKPKETETLQDSSSLNTTRPSDPIAQVPESKQDSKTISEKDQVKKSKQETKPQSSETFETFETSIRAIAEPMEVITPPHFPSSTDLCRQIRLNTNITRPNADILYNLTDKQCGSGFGGTGNVILEYVGLRLAAFAEGNTSLVFDCGSNAIASSRTKIEPWLSGYFPKYGSRAPLDMVPPTAYSQKCPPRPNANRRLNPANTLPLKFMYPLISYDLRRMAVALVGVPDKNHPSAEFEEKYLGPEGQQPPFTPTPETGAVYRVPIHEYYENGPLFPGVKLDDVVIHFRCGDVLLGAYGPFYYPKYKEYTNIISAEVRTIGIITQPFFMEEGTSYRKMDSIDKSGERCKVLVMGLVEYLKVKFPKAATTIHNGPGETVALAYARLIMANQTFGLIPSTFSTFPVMASFGTGYVTKPERVKGSFAGYFLNNEMTKDIYKDKPVEVDILSHREMLYCQTLKAKWGENGAWVLNWMKNDTDA